MKKPILIELIGLIGSGKTAVFEELSKIIYNKGLTCISESDFPKLLPNRVSRFFYPIYHLFSNKKSLRFLWKLLTYFISTRPITAVEVLLFYYSVKVFLIRNYLINTKKSDFYIFEGPMHLISCFNVQEEEKKQLKDLTDLFFRETLDLFVFVDLPVEFALKRLAHDNPSKRPSVLLKLPSNKIKTLYQRNMLNLNFLADYVKKKHKEKFLKIDGVDSAVKNAQLISEKLQSYF